MATPKLRKSLADYVTIAICPALIMALVGSLGFFLLEVFYTGQYETRLQWVLFFFIFAAVLIARISMQQDGGARAPIYGAALGLVTFLCMMFFIEYKTSLLAAFGWLINIVLLGIVWWCAHKLTYDCTYLEDDVDASGKGILDAAGLGENAEAAAANGDAGLILDEDEPPEEKPKAEDRSLTWWERYLKRREEHRQKSHTPGVWVVYFSLAALPLFGVGQLMVPADEAGKKSYVFWLLAIYVASGLGLLLTTSFIGLRRYLRQRKVQMPAAMTGAWLAMGGALVLALVGIGLVLPLPSPGNLLGKPSFMGSKERQASKYAVNRDSKGKGSGAASSSKLKDANAKPGAGNMRDPKGGQTKSGESGSGNSQSNSGQQSKSGQSNRQGGQGKSNQQGSEKSGGNRRDNQAQQNQNDRNGEQKQGDEKQADKEDENAEKKDDDGGGGSEPNDEEQETSAPMRLLEETGGTLGMVLWWVALIVGIIVGGYFVLKFFANFSSWVRALLEALRNLFGRKETQTAAIAQAAAEPEEEWSPRPFAEYPDPFLSGAASTMPPAQLVRYSFEALQSWAWEQRLARQPEETPMEFAGRLGSQLTKLEAPVRRLADLFARVSYARQTLNRNCLPVLQQFWQELRGVQAPAENVIEEQFT